MQAIIEFIPDDAEASRAAGNIGLVIKEAGWNIVSFGPNPKADGDGVTVEQYLAPKPSGEAFFGEERKSQEAASALVEFLESNRWEAQEGFASRAPIDAIPSNTVRIRVGLESSPFFDPEWVKELKQRSKEIRERIKTTPKNP